MWWLFALMLVASGIEELHLAARSGDLKQVEALIKNGAPVDGRNSLGGTPLHDAAWAGATDVVECLIRAGADVNARHSEGLSTPLDYAVLMNRAEVVRILLDHGATIDAGPLELAARRGEVEIAQMLIAHGANVDARDPSGSSPIEEASWRGEAGIVRLLIANKADPNSVNPTNRVTPLHAAAIKGQIEIASALIAAGAKIDAQDKDGATPFDDALHYRNARMIDLLISASAKITTSNVRDAVMRGQADVVALLVNRMPPLGSTTLLHDAALKGYAEIIDILIAHGADVNARNDQGSTPLHDAALAGQLAVAATLIRHGAKIDAINRDTKATPLHLAASWGRTDVVDLLLAHGANFSLKDKKGKTPLDLAVANGQNEAAQILRSTKRQVSVK